MRILRMVLGAIGLAALVGTALAQGPGMWGGPGGGPGGMMGHGYGPGPMMGPGMMGGDGPGHYGMPGMMGHGPGAMSFGRDMQQALGLSDEQRKKLDAIHDDLQTKTWDIMGKMRVEMTKMRELMAADTLDKPALDAVYKSMNDLRLQRFDAHLAAHEQMIGVLTKEQRQQLEQLGPWWMSRAD